MLIGQLISREIVDYDEPGCPRELIGVDVRNDSVFTSVLDKKHMIQMPVYRSKYDKLTGSHKGNPRKQVRLLLHSRIPSSIVCRSERIKNALAVADFDVH